MKKIIIGIIIVILAVVVFFILKNNKERNQEKVAIVKMENNKIAVKTAEVKKSKVSSKFTANGTFEPERKAYVSPEMGGQITAIYVDEGDYVTPGQIIAKLKGDKVNVGVEAAKAQLENAKASLTNAKSQLKRFEAAYKTGGVTDQQIDQMRLQVQQLESQVKGAQASYKNAKLASGDTNVRSKVRGIVNRKLAEVGTVTGPGNPIVEVVDISKLKLKVNVDENLVAKIHKGDVVSVQPSVLSEPIQGKITFIAPLSDGALKFPVEITIENSDKKLKAGMYATANFDQNGEGDAETILVPREAFVGSISNNQIFQVKDSIAHLIKVQSGRNFGDEVEIISGLTPNDVVVISGQVNLQDKSKVKIVK